MSGYDHQSESFIIRIWREPRELQGAPTVWRGELEHVTSQKRHFFRKLGDIAALIRPYLAQIGIEADTSPTEAGDEE